MAAAGLWTTAEDLAKFLIDLQLSLRGESNKVLNTEFAKAMLTPTGVDYYSLGLVIAVNGPEVYFGHDGGNVGFKARIIGHKEAGVGAVVMTNSENGIELAGRIVELIAREEGWPGS